MKKDKIVRVAIIVLGFLSPVFLMNYLEQFKDGLLLVISLLLGGFIAVFLWGLLFKSPRDTSAEKRPPGAGKTAWLTWASVVIAVIVIVMEGGFYYLLSPETTADPRLPLSAAVFILMICSFLFCLEGGGTRNGLFSNRRVIGVFLLAAVLTIISAYVSVFIDNYRHAGYFFYAIAQISLAIMAGAALAPAVDAMGGRLSRKGPLTGKADPVQDIEG